MQIKIEDETIRQNIEFFLEILRRAQRKKDQRVLEEADYRACVNRATGKLFFEESSVKGDSLEQQEWKPILIHYEFDSREGELLFEIDEAEHQHALFKTDDLSPLACRIMFQTLKVLNELCHRLKGPSDPESKISVLTRLKIDTGLPHPDRNLIISAWHQVDRFGAEDLLWNRPVGTYLFRKDEYAKILEFQLAQQLGKKIKCVTLTLREPDSKIAEFTLVHHEHYWQVYDDDPSLEQKNYSNINDLIKSFTPQLKYPLFH